MAKTKHSEFAQRTHDALHDVAAPYHERLHQIARVEQRCKLQRAVLKATATAEVSQTAAGLKLSGEALRVLCW